MIIIGVIQLKYSCDQGLAVISGVTEALSSVPIGGDACLGRNGTRCHLGEVQITFYIRLQKITYQLTSSYCKNSVFWSFPSSNLSSDTLGSFIGALPVSNEADSCFSMSLVLLATPESAIELVLQQPKMTGSGMKASCRREMNYCSISKQTHPHGTTLTPDQDAVGTRAPIRSLRQPGFPKFAIYFDSTQYGVVYGH